MDRRRHKGGVGEDFDFAHGGGGAWGVGAQGWLCGGEEPAQAVRKQATGTR